MIAMTMLFILSEFSFKMIQTLLPRQLDPDGRMVTGLLPSAHFTVDAGGDEAAGYMGAQQEMIDPQAGIATIGVAEIIPEGIDRFVGM